MIECIPPVRIILFLAFVGFLPACRTIPVPTIIFDESLEEFFSIYDPGAMGYSRAAELLRANGYQVTTNLLPLPETLSLLEPRYTALVLGGRWAVPWTDNQRGALGSFVERGGTLVLLVEHDDAYGLASAANDLLQGTGLFVGSGRALGVENVGLSPGPVTIARVPGKAPGDSVLLYFAAPLSWEPQAKVRVLAQSAQSEVVAALARKGKGQIVVIGDIEFLWNGGERFGIRAVQNSEFWVMIFSNRFGRPPRARQKEAGPTRRWDRPAVFAWAPDQHVFGAAGDAFGRLIAELRGSAEVIVADSVANPSEIDALMVVQPTRPVPQYLQSIPRLILIVNSTSGGAGDLPGLLGQLDRGGFVGEHNHPAAPLLDPAGIRIVAGVLRDSAGRMWLTDEAKGCRWHRVPALDGSWSGVSIDTISSVFAQNTNELLPIANLKGGLSTGGERGRFPIILRASQFFVSAGSALTNATWSDTCAGTIAREIADWLRSR